MGRGGRTVISGIWPTSPAQPDTGISLSKTEALQKAYT
jgi:hypothetical protein